MLIHTCTETLLSYPYHYPTLPYLHTFVDIFFLRVLYIIKTNRQCYVCMSCNMPTPGHPNTADETWYWPKHVLCTVSFDIYRTVCKRLFTAQGVVFHSFSCACTNLLTQGFICPICMEALRSAEALQVHWEAAHSSDGGGASATPTKAKPAQYVM